MAQFCGSPFLLLNEANLENFKFSDVLRLAWLTSVSDYEQTSPNKETELMVETKKINTKIVKHSKQAA